VQAKLNCEYDDLSYNVLHNQIIKTTIFHLLKFKKLNKDIQKTLGSVYQRLNPINIFKLTKRHFGLVQLHSNNYFYQFLLNICELLFDSLLIHTTPKKTLNTLK
jgi:5-methylcytosine-specific restriction enzyme subunit McrC